jgi:uncharacterized membrane protein YoaK (UPF0700 family)
MLPLLLSTQGGYVDTAGFLALQGLFTAHVTGNFVTLGASLVLGTSGAVAKLLALPIFCAVVVVTRLVSYGLPRRGLPILRSMLTLKVALLTLGAFLAIFVWTVQKRRRRPRDHDRPDLGLGHGDPERSPQNSHD